MKKNDPAAVALTWMAFALSLLAAVDFENAAAVAAAVVAVVAVVAAFAADSLTTVHLVENSAQIT